MTEEVITANTVTRISQREHIGWGIVEKDYYLTLLLDGIAHTLDLKNMIAFKGGTALRKSYFKDYRYSEDLDFTLKEKLTQNKIENSLNKVFGYLKKEYNIEFTIKSVYARPHFTDVKVQFTGLKGHKNTITLDFMKDEILVDQLKEREIFNPYYTKKFTIPTYSLNEIMAEKLRSLLQRTRIRDYYDTWYLLTHAKNKLDLEKVKYIFRKKTVYKKIKFTSTTELINEEKLEQAQAYYEQQLAHQLPNLPNFEIFAKQLIKHINQLEL